MRQRLLFICALAAPLGHCQLTCGFPCVRGSYCLDAFKFGCRECAAGTYSPDQDLTYCTPCAPGQYQDRAAANSCIACPAGKYQQDARKRLCWPCREGRTSTPRATACGHLGPPPAASGRKQAGNSSAPAVGSGSAVRAASMTAQSAALGCAPGQRIETSDLGGFSCSFCAEGRFGTAARTCESCAVGRFQPYGGKTTCFACPAGRFSDTAGAASCSATGCTAGQHQVSASSAGCATCRRGQYQPLAATQLRCRPCDCKPGTFRLRATPTQCTCQACPPGQHQVGRGVARCSLCGPGRMQPLRGSLKCAACPGGKWPNGVGTACEGSCAAGSYRPAVPRSSEAGAAATGATAGVAPPRQLPSVHRGCKKCPASKFSKLANSQSCAPCVCARGRYQAKPSTRCHCALCPSGRYQPGFGHAHCDACAAGSAQPVPGSFACAHCAAGQHQPRAGRPSCRRCDVGQYQPHAGQVACVSCGWAPAGETPRLASLDGRHCLEQCPAGRFATAALTGKHAMQRWGDGRKGGDSGSAAAAAAAAAAASFAKATAEEGGTGTSMRARCAMCPPGKFRAAAAAQPLAHRHAAAASVPGKVRAAEAQDARCGRCRCGAGRFQHDVASCRCDACPDGKYSKYASSFYCFRCPKGKFSRALPAAPGSATARLRSVTKCVPRSQLPGASGGTSAAQGARKQRAGGGATTTKAPTPLPEGMPASALARNGKWGKSVVTKTRAALARLGTKCPAGTALPALPRFVSIRELVGRLQRGLRSCRQCDGGSYRDAKASGPQCAPCKCLVGKFQRDVSSCVCEIDADAKFGPNGGGAPTRHGRPSPRPSPPTPPPTAAARPAPRVAMFEQQQQQQQSAAPTPETPLMAMLKERERVLALERKWSQKAARPHRGASDLGRAATGAAVVAATAAVQQRAAAHAGNGAWRANEANTRPRASMHSEPVLPVHRWGSQNWRGPEMEAATSAVAALVATIGAICFLLRCTRLGRNSEGASGAGGTGDKFGSSVGAGGRYGSGAAAAGIELDSAARGEDHSMLVMSLPYAPSQRLNSAPGAHAPPNGGFIMRLDALER